MDSMKTIAEALKGSRRVVVATHVSPDADALGSSFGLALGLHRIGVEVRVAYENELPERFLPLLPAELLRSSGGTSEDPDVLVVLDTASVKRVAGVDEQLLKGCPLIINIDHHVSNDNWARLNYVDAKAAATAELVIELLDELGAGIDRRLADLLYAGILDDTGMFRYSNTSPRALEAAARLVGCGAKPSELSNQLYFSVPERVFRLRALAMSGMRVELGGKVSLLTVTNKMLDEAGAQAADTEGLVDEARSVSGTVAAIFIRELEEGWKASLRSKHKDLDVNKIASAYGGGGHAAAAGCKLLGTQEEVEAEILKAFEATVGKGLM